MISKPTSLPRTRTSALFAVTAAILVFLAWAGRAITQWPDAGIRDADEHTGRIEALDPASPAAAILRMGDVILTIEGLPPSRAMRALAGLRPGGTAHLTVVRSGATLDLAVPLRRPPAAQRWLAFSPVLVGLVFVLIGALVFLRVPVDRRSVLFFLVCHVFGGVLGIGLLSVLGRTWAANAFCVLLWFTAPLLLHFHLALLGVRQGSVWRPVLAAAYAVSAAGSLPYLFRDAVALREMPWHDVLYVGGRLDLAAGVLISAGLLLHAHRKASSPASRKATLAVLAGVSGPVLFIALSVLPDALARSPLLSYYLSFLFLLSVPLGYGLALLRSESPAPMSLEATG